MNLGLPKDCQWRVEVRPFGLVPHPTSEIPENVDPVDPESVIEIVPANFLKQWDPVLIMPRIHHGKLLWDPRMKKNEKIPVFRSKGFGTGIRSNDHAKDPAFGSNTTGGDE